MMGRQTKERITKDVRYQESREVTLEWWDYNRHSRVTSFLGALSIRAEQKPLFQANPIHLNFKHTFFKVEIRPTRGGFLH